MFCYFFALTVLRICRRIISAIVTALMDFSRVALMSRHASLDAQPGARRQEAELLTQCTKVMFPSNAAKTSCRVIRDGGMASINPPPAPTVVFTIPADLRTEAIFQRYFKDISCSFAISDKGTGEVVPCSARCSKNLVPYLVLVDIFIITTSSVVLLQ